MCTHRFAAGEVTAVGGHMRLTAVICTKVTALVNASALCNSGRLTRADIIPSEIATDGIDRAYGGAACF